MTKATAREHADLWRLAHRCGVKPAFIGSGLKSLPPTERRRRSTPEAVMAALRSLDVPIDRHEQAREAIRAVEQQYWQRVIEPVIVHWQGQHPTVALRLNDRQVAQPIELLLLCESGDERRWMSDLDDRVVTRTADVEGVRYAVVHVTLPNDLPAGYHTLTLSIDSDQHTAKLFVAPPRAMAMRDDRAWGVFMPLYALRTERDWGVGDLTDLRKLLEWTQHLGGSVVGTLPLLATYLDRPCDPSPYTPVSRLFFNELYLDVESLIRESPDASRHELERLIASDNHRRTVDALRAIDHVDFARVMAVKRAVLESLARAAFADAALRSVIERDTNDDPYLAEYARFRAAVERHGSDWHNWPEKLHGRIRGNSLAEDDADPRAVEYHLYVQHQLRRQLARITDADRSPGRGLYLDLPVGVHSHGYDAWRFTACFATGASCGAPPDELFIGGQNWGFAPLHPHHSREYGHEWFIQAIRRHLPFAGLLRIDHVMWLHRMYWVPTGLPATDGVYVRNPAPDEFYAILAIESHRQWAAIVGENLGTVPDIVNRTMRRRGMYSLAVGQFLLTPDAERPLPDIPTDAVASMNTHDTPTFAGFWKDRDIDQRIATGLLGEEDAAKQRAFRACVRECVMTYLQQHDDRIVADDPQEPPRPPPLGTITARLIEALGTSNAAAVLATLEDLWQEEQPQNVPGTMGDRNWSRRAAMTMEQMIEHPTALDALNRVDRGRRGRRICDSRSFDRNE